VPVPRPWMCLRYALGDLVVLEPLPAGHHDVRILFEAGPVFGRCWSRDDAAATVEPYLWWDPVVKAGAMVGVRAVVAALCAGPQRGSSWSARPGTSGRARTSGASVSAVLNSCPPPAPVVNKDKRRMEPLWSPVVATGGNRRQIDRARKRPKHAKTVDGKEGVDGSSPSEGFEESPAKAGFLSSRTPVLYMRSAPARGGQMEGHRDSSGRLNTVTEPRRRTPTLPVDSSNATSNEPQQTSCT